MKLLKETDDPDLRKSIYGLFASISTVMGKEMTMALPEIIEHMIMSIRNSDGIVVNIKSYGKIKRNFRKSQDEYYMIEFITDTF